MAKPNSGSRNHLVLDPFLKVVGQRLKQARQNKKMTVSDALDAVGCTRNWLYAIEDGEQNFTISTFQRYLDVLGLTLIDALHPEDWTVGLENFHKIRALAADVAVRTAEISDLSAQILAASGGSSDYAVSSDKVKDHP